MFIFGKRKHESPKAISALDEIELDALNRRTSEEQRAEEKRIDLERLAELGEAMDVDESITLVKVFCKKYGTDFIFKAMTSWMLDEEKGGQNE